MIARLLILTAALLATTAYVTRAMQPEHVPLRRPLSELSLQLGGWSGREGPAFSEPVLAVLGVDEYLHRYYAMPNGQLVNLYIGYYQSQRQGDTIHSPMNCLPGAGWQPVETGRTTVTVDSRSSPLVVNQVTIQKGVDRQMVFYWYQSHGRVVASEYWSKVFMVADAIRTNRSDAALVRVVGPIGPSDGAPAARDRVSAFVQVLFPQLERYLPS
jgi:EpsI family protein